MAELSPISQELLLKEICYINKTTLKSDKTKVHIGNLLLFAPKLINIEQIDQEPLTIESGYDFSLYKILFDICNYNKVNLNESEFLSFYKFININKFSNALLNYVDNSVISQHNTAQILKILEIKFKFDKNPIKFINYLSRNTKDIRVDDILGFNFDLLCYFFENLNFDFNFIEQFVLKSKIKVFNFHITDIDEEKKAKLVKLFDFSPIIKKQNKKSQKTKKIIKKLEKPVDYTPDLFDAVYRGSLDCVLYNLQEDPKRINEKDSKGDNFLCCAAKYGHLEIVKTLIEKGIDKNSQNVNGQTALSYSSSGVDVEIEEYMLQKGCDPKICGNNGWTPLHDAAMLSTYKMVQTLLKYGANPNAVDEEGRKPVDVAIEDDIIELLQNVTN
ncbi:hypothetical protein TVAG_008500 [Trichomonas vaginalis G3]|uniref:Uncharacterized protein n=1 Tax=Trichomonas vaginalis (strain ATCC PRA-98 / G3) TaxID=412133 RepID=A2G141_TRIV3|nr:protein ubiquitination [Trichomonas vaginalis G3]EAX89125.1 hypothetical protein TVAG_008500 [Trichomonas vaginalis G3]KAI5510761.1 protein ubiquitination [Trichomonas vaginalis G3]|eukprot:XP_001302055.1 hypothetical protein [Trichomonas vaginalis G3]